jgi:hypothetical protein
VAQVVEYEHRKWGALSSNHSTAPKISLKAVYVAQPVWATLRHLSLEDLEFQTSLCLIVRLCLMKYFKIVFSKFSLLETLFLVCINSYILYYNFDF